MTTHVTSMQAQLHPDKKIYYKTIGEGEPMVILHGWGMHGGLFRDVFTFTNKQVHLVDLPGHGYSQPFDGFADIEHLTDYLVKELAEILDEGVSVVGWSMGSLLAQSLAARLPDKVKKLVLITGTPAFINRPDWRGGINKDLLENFADDLLADYRKTLGRFLAIQFLGSQEQKKNLQQAKELLFARPDPDIKSLRKGLSLLEQTDLRSNLDAITCPTLVINGERDTLITRYAARYLAENIDKGRAVIISSSGHAPFLSHKIQFNSYLEQFLDE